VSARIVREFADAKRVALVPEGKSPRTYKAVVNPHLVTVTRTDDGVLFDARGPAFIEFVAETPTAGHRLDIALRQTHANDMSAEAGVYVGGAAGPRGTRDFVVFAFGDFGELGTAAPGPRGQPGSVDQLRFIRHAPSVTVPVGVTRTWVDPRLSRWHPVGNEERIVLLDVSNDAVRAVVNGVELPSLRLDRLRTEFLPPDGLPVTARPTGGVGLYLKQCGVAVKHCTLSQLPE
jgi:hypothetical protein